MRPWEIARLTDWQIENLYRKPQLARIAEMSGNRAASADVPDDTPMIPAALADTGATKEDAAAGIKAIIARGEVPPKGMMVTLYMTFGQTYESACAAYDRQLAEWNRTKGARP